MRSALAQSLASLPLFADDDAIGAALLGPKRAVEWKAMVAQLEAKGLPPIDPMFHGRYVSAVRTFFDYAYGLRATLPTTPDWSNFDVADVQLLPPAGSNIYFVAAGHFIKIGYSTNWPQRIAELQVGCPYRLSVLHIMEGPREFEPELHQRFAHLRVQGEWFRRDGDLISYIAQLRRALRGATI